MEVIDRLRTYGRTDFYGLLGFVFFGFFLILSIVLYKECIVHQDYAWELTWILNGNGPTPVYFRWGAIPWRVFFIIGPAIYLSLKSILVLTSAWFVLSKFLTWAICHFYFRNPIAGILVIISILFSHAEGFFAQNLQVYNASVYFCLLYAIITDTIRIKNDWTRIVLVTLMLILIKGTHVAILMACPILILYYISDNFSLKTLLPILFFGGFVVVTQFCFPAPYEQGHLDSMLAAMRSSGLREMSGILIYFLIQIIRFNYVLPLILFTGSLALLFRNKKYLIGFATALYSALFFALILYKLIPYNAEYPLSSDVEFYIQGAFYSLFLMFAANFFYLIQKQNESIMKRTTVKALTIFAIIFFSSQISYAGVKLWEYNRYTNALMSDLSNKYPESIFIIGDQFIPNRFSKINMNVEFETMINSTLYTGIPTALFITPYPKPFKYENGDPLYINSVSQLEKSKEIPTDQSAAHHFKMFYPSRYFEKCNAHYFPFKNFDHRIVNSEYMETFNNEYGFAISEF